MLSSARRIVSKSMNQTISVAAARGHMAVGDTITDSKVHAMMDRYGYSDDTRQIIATERLLPTGLLSRLHATYPQHSGLMETGKFLFDEEDHYSGLEGYRQVVSVLEKNGIH